MTFEEAQEFVEQLRDTRFENLIEKINKANYLALVLFTAQFVYGDIPSEVESVRIAEVLTCTYKSYSKDLWGDLSFQTRMIRSPESLHFYDDYEKWYNSLAGVYGKPLLNQSKIDEKETVFIKKEEVMKDIPSIEQPRAITLSLNSADVVSKNSMESESYRKAKEAVDKFTLSVGYRKEKLKSIAGIFSDTDYYAKFNTIVAEENGRLVPMNMTERQKALYREAKKAVEDWYAK